MSLQRHGEIYPYDEGTTQLDRAPAHRLDEFPAGYSWRGALQCWASEEVKTGKELCATM